MSQGAAAYNGGNWSNGANAGLLYLNVNNAPSNANTNIGARLANDTGQMPSGPRAGGQRPSFGAAVLTRAPARATVEDPQSRAATVARDAQHLNLILFIALLPLIWPMLLLVALGSFAAEVIAQMRSRGGRR